MAGRTQKNINVLVIEDHVDTQRILKVRLKKRGYRPFIAGSAEEGLAIARSFETINIILMDLELPGKNGRDATRELKQDERTKHIPVIAVSSNIDYRKKDELDEIGFDALCLKPIDFDRLFRTIMSLGQQQSLAAS
jgi:CheY-like chemotaxis protein